MDHVAIMRKEWGLVPKILTGEKTIESRWYKTQHAPWGGVKRGDTVYFKNAGEPVTMRAEVKRVAQYADLTPARVKKLLRRYGKLDGIGKAKLSSFFRRFKNREYCILVFLKNPRKVKPFEISKKGFGVMCAWITVSSIAKIRR
jgi:ASC-1-like (ASCH) protein